MFRNQLFQEIKKPMNKRRNQWSYNLNKKCIPKDWDLERNNRMY